MKEICKLDLNQLYDSEESNVMKDYVATKEENKEKKDVTNENYNNFYEDEESLKMLKIINNSAEIESIKRREKKLCKETKLKRKKIKIIMTIFCLLLLNLAILYSLWVRTNG